MDINGASAIVTGAASGIGAAVARQLAARGAHVVVADLNQEKGEALAAEIGGVFAPVDVTRTEQIQAAVEEAEQLGPLRRRAAAGREPLCGPCTGRVDLSDALVLVGPRRTDNISPPSFRSSVDRVETQNLRLYTDAG